MNLPFLCLVLKCFTKAERSNLKFHRNHHGHGHHHGHGNGHISYNHGDEHHHHHLYSGN